MLYYIYALHINCPTLSLLFKEIYIYIYIFNIQLRLKQIRTFQKQYELILYTFEKLLHLGYSRLNRFWMDVRLDNLYKICLTMSKTWRLRSIQLKYFLDRLLETNFYLLIFLTRYYFYLNIFPQKLFIIPKIFHDCHLRFLNFLLPLKLRTIYFNAHTVFTDISKCREK